MKNKNRKNNYGFYDLLSNDNHLIPIVVLITILYFNKFEKNIYHCSKLTQVLTILLFIPLKNKLKYSHICIKSFFYFVFTWHFLHSFIYA